MTDWETYANQSPHDERLYREVEPVNQMRVDKIVSRCVGSVLDVGGADGYPASQIAAAGHPVMMVDISPVRVERARALGVDAYVGDAYALPFADGSFDTVVLGEILEHLDNPGRALDEATRVARTQVIATLPLRGWADPTHRWRVSIDHVRDRAHTARRHTRGEQIVLTMRRGVCWPADYYKTDPTWAEQFGRHVVDWEAECNAALGLVASRERQISRLAGELYDARRELAQLKSSPIPFDPTPTFDLVDAETAGGNPRKPDLWSKRRRFLH